jgi:hypothetical protein
MHWRRRVDLTRGFVLRICQRNLLDYCSRCDMRFSLMIRVQVRSPMFQVMVSLLQTRACQDNQIHITVSVLGRNICF